MASLHYLTPAPRVAEPVPAALPSRPLAFLAHYMRRHPIGHGIVAGAVLVAVGCSVSTQYGMKHLIDVIARGPDAGSAIWWAFGLLAALVAADNLLWRVAGYSAA